MSNARPMPNARRFAVYARDGALTPRQQRQIGRMTRKPGRSASRASGVPVRKPDPRSQAAREVT